MVTPLPGSTLSTPVPAEAPGPLQGRIGRPREWLDPVRVVPGHLAEPPERAVERDLDGVRLQPEHLADLACGEVGAVTEREQLAFPFVDLGKSRREFRTLGRLVLEIAGRCLIERLAEERRSPQKMIVDAAPGDSDEPRRRLPFARVERVAGAQRALERLGRHVLGVRPVAEPVRRVRVDALDQRLGIRERIATHHDPYSSLISGLSGFRNRARASACSCASPFVAAARSNQISQLFGSFAVALRSVADACGSRSASCASPSIRHGSADHGIQCIALRASAADTRQSPCVAASRAPATAVLPTTPTNAKAANAAATAATPQRARPPRRTTLRSSPRALTTITTPQRSAATVIAGSCQSQSTAACARYAMYAPAAAGTSARRRAYRSARSGVASAASSSTSPGAPSSANVCV